MHFVGHMPTISSAIFMLLDVVLHLGLINANGVAPRADDGHISAGNGGNAVVGAARDLDLELVGERGTMELILELMGERIADLHGVDVRELAAGFAGTAARGTEAGAGAAEVPALCRCFREDGLELVGLRAEEDEVAGGPVHVRQAAAVFVPDIHELTKRARRIVEAGGLVDTNGVEVSDARIFLGKVAVTADNAAAVTKDAHDTAVLPVGNFIPV